MTFCDAPGVPFRKLATTADEERPALFIETAKKSRGNRGMITFVFYSVRVRMRVRVRVHGSLAPGQGTTPLPGGSAEDKRLST